MSRSTLLKQRLNRFTRVLPDVEKGDMRALHRTRVASRRLRELVPVLQLEGDIARKLSRRLRKVTAQLGTVRELDALLLLIDDLQASLPMHRDALRRVGAAVVKSRDRARKALADRLPADEMWRLARKLGRVLEELRSEETGVWARAGALAGAVDTRVAHRAARLTEALRVSGAVYLPERLHAARIAVKKLRYALELSADRSPSTLRSLERMQAVLGRMHDFQGLIDRVRDVQASLTPPSLPVWRELDALIISLDEACRRLHARYVRERESLRAMAARLSTHSGGPVRHSERQAG
ncbi:MAG TPA: CHAD domain-containing protein [Vicinamibacterales bacterium]|nr:CHAD domain-containing protein [Vicinamibacterales bacterium]